jgi:hypothetical protein
MNAAQLLRARLTIQGGAYGDAIGSRYKGFAWRRQAAAVGFGRGVVLWRRPGRWTDGTDMTLALLLTLTAGPNGGLRSLAALARIGRGWLDWRDRVPIVGVGAGTVTALDRLRARLDAGQPAALEATDGAGRSGGNGAVLHAGPVAVACLGDPAVAYRSAETIYRLTHPDRRAAQAAGVLAVLFETAISTGVPDPYLAAALTGDAGWWLPRLTGPRAPGRNDRRGSAVAALLDAWWLTRAHGHGPDAVAAVCRAAAAAGGGTVAGAAAALTASTGSALPHDAGQVWGGRWTGRTWTIGEIGDLAVSLARIRTGR